MLFVLQLQLRVSEMLGSTPQAHNLPLTHTNNATNASVNAPHIYAPFVTVRYCQHVYVSKVQSVLMPPLYSLC